MKPNRNENNNKFGNPSEGSVRSNVISIESEAAQAGMRRHTIRKDHEEAVRTFAVEAYLLEEMSEDEQLRFEQHCVECAVCASAVEAGRTLIYNIGPIPPDPAPLRQRIHRWFTTAATGQWLKMAAAMAALFLPFLAWQQYEIVGLTSVHANTVILARGSQKGGGPEDKTTYEVKTPSATVEFNLTQGLEFPYFRVQIDGGAQRHLTQVVPAPSKDFGHRLSVQVLEKALGRGHFAVSVEGLEAEDSKSGHKLDDVYGFDLK